METATTTDNDPAPFTGFVPPTANYSKMPHALIDALPLITSLSEMKVILYVLRHTWGYQDDEKRISLDEFRNGRKHTKRYLSRHPDAPPRIDSGTGMSINAIKSGIKRAVKHGFLSVDEDDSDKARIERWYSLSDSDYQELIPDRQELIPRGSEVDSRTLKETLIETTEREEPPLADSPPAGPFYLEGETPTKPVEPRTAEEHKAGIRRAIETFEETGGRPGVADPTQEVDPWSVVLDEFYLRFKPGLSDASSVQGKKRKNQIAKLRTLTQETLADKGLSTEEMIARAAAVIHPLSLTEKWWIKTTTTPFQDGWAEGFTTMLIVNPSVVEAQARDAQRNGGSSGPRQKQTAISDDMVVM